MSSVTTFDAGADGDPAKSESNQPAKALHRSRGKSKAKGASVTPWASASVIVFKSKAATHAGSPSSTSSVSSCHWAWRRQ